MVPQHSAYVRSNQGQARPGQARPGKARQGKARQGSGTEGQASYFCDGLGLAVRLLVDGIDTVRSLLNQVMGSLALNGQHSNGED